MENVFSLLEAIKEREYKVSNGKLNQVERNATKADLLGAFMEDLHEIAIGKCKEGIILQLPNDQEGSIHVILDLKIKPLDYDGYHVVQSYNQDQLEKAERKAQRDRDKAASFKNKQAEIAMREEKGSK